MKLSNKCDTMPYYYQYNLVTIAQLLDKFYCTLLNSNMYDPSENYPTLHYA